MPNKSEEDVLEQIVNDVVKKKNIFGAVFYISSEDCKTDVIRAAGNMTVDSQYYIASINKIFISAIILKLCADNKLNLQDKLAKHLSDDEVKGIHRYKDEDYSDALTLEHLISQTSGLPCYLVDKQANGICAMKELEAGIDQSWPTDRVIQEIKKMKSHFRPGEKGRARYIDSNHQILSRVIENIVGEPIDKILTNLFRDLDLTKTYVCKDTSDHYVPIYYKSKEVHVPQYFISTKNDIVSTAKDQMSFLKAFFQGYFYPRHRLYELEKWNNIFFPFQYGVGIQKFYLPRILSPFQPVPDMIGHCGSTGSVAFSIPEKGLYVTGTINQQASPNIAFQTLIKIINMF
jgi:CubicO group peptidase (beta-lactamase class C family)